MKLCEPHDVLAMLGNKWTVLVVLALVRAPDRCLRFAAIRNGIDGITQRMLTVTLRNLERDGFVDRHYFPEVPPRVEYELTGMGRGMVESLEHFTRWVQANWPHIEDARQAFDRSHAKGAGRT